MRKNTWLLLFIAILYSHMANAQKSAAAFTTSGVPLKDGKPHYEMIDSLSGTKDQIFTACLATMVEIFKDSKSVLEINNPADGHLMGKGNTLGAVAFWGLSQQIRYPFIVEIKAKEGKYRLQIRDIDRFIIEAQIASDYSWDEKNISEKQYTKVAKDMNERITSLMSRFRDKVRERVGKSDDF